MNDDKYFYVRLTMSVWPEIYGDEKPILFPTEKAAVRFAECNLSPLIPKARVYTPDHKLLDTFQFA